MTDPDSVGQISASEEADNQELDGSGPPPAIAAGADVAVSAVKREIGGADVAEGSEDGDEEEEANPSELGEKSGQEVEGPGKEVENEGADVAVAVEGSRRDGGEGSKGTPCQGVMVAVRAMVRPVSGEKKYAVQRSSCFHGVTRLKWSGKFEAHLWDNTSRMEGRKRKGKHVYLGTYDSEEEAARAHDLAALKYWGPTPNAKLNFAATNYEKDLETMKTMTQEEYVAHVRRKNSSFSRGSSSYRGVTRRRKGGKWQARIGRVGDKTDAKDIYLGTFDTEEEAAEAYDLAAIQLRGAHAVTNFDISNYYDEGLVPIEGACKRLAM